MLRENSDVETRIWQKRRTNEIGTEQDCALLKHQDMDVQYLARKRWMMTVDGQCSLPQ
jgi:hypothetical protein